MAWFNSNKSKKNVLPELEWYYDGERRDKSRKAWVLAVASIFGAVLLLLGLFFGGRAIYRQVNKDDKAKTAQTDTSKDDAKQSTGDDSGELNEEVPADSQNSTETQTTPTDSEAEDADRPAAGTPAPAATPSPTPTPTPAPVAAAPAPNKLTNTGPASVVPVFAAVSILGTLAYRFKLRRSSL